MELGEKPFPPFVSPLGWQVIEGRKFVCQLIELGVIEVSIRQNSCDISLDARICVICVRSGRGIERLFEVFAALRMTVCSQDAVTSFTGPFNATSTSLPTARQSDLIALASVSFGVDE